MVAVAVVVVEVAVAVVVAVPVVVALKIDAGWLGMGSRRGRLRPFPATCCSRRIKDGS